MSLQSTVNGLCCDIYNLWDVIYGEKAKKLSDDFGITPADNTNKPSNLEYSREFIQRNWDVAGYNTLWNAISAKNLAICAITSVLIDIPDEKTLAAAAGVISQFSFKK